MKEELVKFTEEIVARVKAELRAEVLRPNRECFTAEEVAEMAGRSAKTIMDHEKEGKIKARFPNAKRRYHRDDVNWYLRGMKVPKNALKKVY